MNFLIRRMISVLCLAATGLLPALNASPLDELKAECEQKKKNAGEDIYYWAKEYSHDLEIVSAGAHKPYEKDFQFYVDYLKEASDEFRNPVDAAISVDPSLAKGDGATLARALLKKLQDKDVFALENAKDLDAAIAPLVQLELKRQQPNSREPRTGDEKKFALLKELAKAGKLSERGLLSAYREHNGKLLFWLGDVSPLFNNRKTRMKSFPPAADGTPRISTGGLWLNNFSVKYFVFGEAEKKLGEPKEKFRINIELDLRTGKIEPSSLAEYEAETAQLADAYSKLAEAFTKMPVAERIARSVPAYCLEL